MSQICVKTSELRDASKAMPWRASDSQKKRNTWLTEKRKRLWAKAIRMTDGTVHRGIKIRTLLSSSTAAKANPTATGIKAIALRLSSIIYGQYIVNGL